MPYLQIAQENLRMRQLSILCQMAGVSLHGAHGLFFKKTIESLMLSFSGVGQNQLLKEPSGS